MGQSLDSGLSFRDVVGPPWGEEVEEEAEEQVEKEEEARIQMMMETSMKLKCV